jgi:uncharacterized membrane protein
MNVLLDWVARWSALFSNSAALRTLIDFIHIGGLLGAGGAAIAVDRATMRAAGASDADRAAQLHAIHTSHRFVVAGLTAVVVSGLLLFAADTDTFLHSRVFWLKMGLLGLLLMNGLLLVRTAGNAGSGEQAAWQRLRVVTIASLTLWFLITLAGAALPNLG